MDEIIQQTQQQNTELKVKLEESENQRQEAPQLQDIIEMQRIVQRATEDSETNRNLLKNLKADHDKQLVIHIYDSSSYLISKCNSFYYVNKITMFLFFKLYVDPIE